MFGVKDLFFLFVFFKSIGVGFLVGALYAVFMLLRLLGVNGRAAVFIQDFVFCVLACAVSFIALFDIIAGKPRLYFLCGEAIGFFLFLLLPARSLVFLLKKRLRGRKGKRAPKREAEEEKKS